MESLAGYFLISTPQMPDPRFQRQVIYLCAHNDEGAMGLVINNPNPEITLFDVFHGTNLTIRICYDGRVASSVVLNNTGRPRAVRGNLKTPC